MENKLSNDLPYRNKMVSLMLQCCKISLKKEKICDLKNAFGIKSLCKLLF